MSRLCSPHVLWLAFSIAAINSTVGEPYGQRGKQRSILAQSTINLQQYDNYDIVGRDAKIINSSDPQACSTACQSTPECRAFSFEKWKNRCGLKATASSLRFDPGFIVGLPAKLPLPAISENPMKMQHLLGKRFTGTGYRSTSGLSLERCEALCQSDEACVAFSQSNVDASCHLFATTGGYTEKQGSNSGFKWQQLNVESSSALALVRPEVDVSGERSGDRVPSGRDHKSSPSYDCVTNHQADERAICNDDNLSELDRRMALVYSALILRLSKSKQNDLRDQQREWLRRRARCGSDVDCLWRVYEARIPQLEAGDASNSQGGPSFDCVTNHHVDEIAICNDDNLSRLDRRMAGLYANLRGGLTRIDQIKLRDRQREWLQQRAGCKGNLRCLLRVYEDRISELETLQ
jgi:uncharacterized protein